MFINTLIKINSINLANDILTFKEIVKTDTSNMSIAREEAFLNSLYALEQSIVKRIIQDNPDLSTKEIEFELNQ